MAGACGDAAEMVRPIEALARTSLKDEAAQFGLGMSWTFYVQAA